ncbi:MAG: hypothetical protein AAFX78_02440 [Cyanobacteria bacterium J06638_20]
MWWTTLISWITNPVVKWTGAVLGAWLLVSQVVGVIEDRALAEQRVKQLEADKQILLQTNEAVERARLAAEQTTVDRDQELTRLRGILDEVRNAPPEDDGPMAPVLRCAVTGVCAE